MVRFVLCESGSFPGSIKTVAEWFPKKERALATGIFNSGTSIGAIVMPLVVPWITYRFAWQMAFIGTLGRIWHGGCSIAALRNIGASRGKTWLTSAVIHLKWIRQKCRCGTGSIIARHR